MAKMSKMGKAGLASIFTLMLFAGLVVMVVWGNSESLGEGTSFGLMGDFETNYINKNISDAIPDNSSYVSDFDITANLNETLDPLAQLLQTREDEDTSLIGDLFRGGMFLVTAIFQLPLMMFEVVLLGNTMITIFLKDLLGVPEPIIFMALISGLVWVCFKLVSYARRYDT